ncbi:HamA C-terminal domain-containing protein [Staphylococcus hominis]|uniref:HamA C-terminal domain-containing protein n=1 Tax=Staphylococcus hominis TaxID=1290 RepID=UPI0011A2F955|nr:DUF1837 domain-containing protein [Staphylococcus hominis]
MVKQIVHNPDNQNNLHTFYIDFDLSDTGELEQVKEEFYNVLFDDIPNFAFGQRQIVKRLNNDPNIVKINREAFKKIYSIPEIKKASDYYLNSNEVEDKYLRKGEFGELILYHLLHHYFQAESLISKIYFKDSNNIAAHGFDAVHVNVSKKELWLGESKLYHNGNSAIKELVKDLETHFNRDFFKSEFTIINNRVQDDDAELDDFMKTLISPDTRCLDKLANIKIALFAGFTSKHISNRNGFEDEYKFNEELNKESIDLLSSLNKKKESHTWIDYLDIYLFLLPLDNKKEFVKDLHIKLKGAQQI